MTDPSELEEKRQQERAPVEEAGGGEAEGFEQAEEELIDSAEGTTPEGGGGHPLGDEMHESAEGLAANTVHGEADHAESTDEAEEPGGAEASDPPTK